MASAVYPSAKEAFLSGVIDLTSDTIKAALVDTSYEYNSAHDYYNDVSGDVVGTPVTIDNKSVTGGVFDTSDDSETFSSVTGNPVDFVVVYKDTGNAATSPLICYIELPSTVTPNGGDIIIDWDDGTVIDGIFSL